METYLLDGLAVKGKDIVYNHHKAVWFFTTDKSIVLGSGDDDLAGTVGFLFKLDAK